MPRPNIVMIMSDQQRWDTLAGLGYEHMITPHLDALIRRGVGFSRAFAQGSVCGPSRNSVVSGKYVHAHGVYQNECWMSPEEPNWIESLRQGGYHTANIGKMHTVPLRLPCGFDFRLVVENKNYQPGVHLPDPDDYDLFLAEHGLTRPAVTYFETIPDWPDCLGATTWPHAEELFPDNFIGQQTIDYLQGHNFTRPLFLWAGFAGPHDPFDVTASQLERYAGVEIPDPVGYPGELDTKPPEQRRSMDALGQLENTLFVFTSDHGDCLGDHGLVYKFATHYDPVVRVPLVFAGPGVAALGVEDPLVESIDLGPTLLDLTGIAPPEGMHGRSIRALLEGDRTPLHEVVYCEQGHRVMVRTTEWKLVYYLDQPWGELYHLVEDPDELHNLYETEAGRTKRYELEEQLLDWYGTTRYQRSR